MPTQIHDTVFPTATDKDLQTAIRIVKEKYGRFYPLVRYESLDIAHAPPGEGEVTDTAPHTVIDDLWGEPVPPNMLPGTVYTNPHTTTALDATVGDQRIDMGEVRVRINHNPSEKALSKFGLDEKRLVTAVFFIPLLEELGITVHHGDQFFWERYVYEVRKWYQDGYWKNTAVPLYIHCACTLARYGS